MPKAPIFLSAFLIEEGIVIKVHIKIPFPVQVFQIVLPGDAALSLLHLLQDPDGREQDGT